MFENEIRQIAIIMLDSMIQNGCPTWKIGKDITHFNTRKDYGYIPDDMTIDDYNKLIMNIIQGNDNELYLYFVKGYKQNYFVIGDGKWIVMVGENGVMETSFPPDDYKGYLNKSKGYTYLGTLKEVRSKWI